MFPRSASAPGLAFSIRLGFGIATLGVVFVVLISGLRAYEAGDIASAVFQVALGAIVCVPAFRSVFGALQVRAGLDDDDDDECGDLAPRQELDGSSWPKGNPIYEPEHLVAILKKGQLPGGKKLIGFPVSIMKSRFPGLVSAPRHLRILVEGVVLASLGVSVMFALLLLFSISTVAAGASIGEIGWRVAIWIVLISIISQWRTGLPNSPLARKF